MELKEGMYVRNNNFGIGKINKEYFDDNNKHWFNVQFNCYKDEDCHCGICEETIGFKASYNIIDLIKHKDIILGKDGKLYQCWKVYKDYVFTYSKNKQGQIITLVDYQIDKVMCYEQFESMSYKVGE